MQYIVSYIRDMLRDKSQQEGPQGLDVRGVQHGPFPHHTLLDRGCSLEQDIVTLAVLCSSKHNILLINNKQFERHTNSSLKSNKNTLYMCLYLVKLYQTLQNTWKTWRQSDIYL